MKFRIMKDVEAIFAHATNKDEYLEFQLKKGTILELEEVIEEQAQPNGCVCDCHYNIKSTEHTQKTCFSLCYADHPTNICFCGEAHG